MLGLEQPNSTTEAKKGSVTVANSELSNNEKIAEQISEQISEKIEGLLHDGIAPHLVISRQQLELLMASLDESTLSEQQQAMLIKSWRALSDGLTALSAVMMACKDTQDEASLDDKSLFPTTENVLTQFTPLLDLAVQTDSNEPALMANKKLGLCLQELLTNALKHSSETNVTVNLRRDGPLAKLTVTSTGIRQSNNQAETSGTGLERLQRRLTAWGGTLCVNEENNNFKVELSLPLY